MSLPRFIRRSMFVGLPLIGCASDIAGAPQSLESGAVAPDLDMHATITDVAFEGALCGSAAGRTVRFSDRHDVVHVDFSDAVLESDPETLESGPETLQTVSGACRVSVELELPAGYQMAGPLASWAGYAQDGWHTRRYGYSGEAEVTFPEQAAEDANFSVFEQAQIWSPTCQQSRRATLVATFAADVRGRLHLDRFIIRTDYRGGVKWRSCAGEDFSTPPGEEGERCGGPQALPCRAGLECEIPAVPAVDGACVDPHEPVPPASRGNVCGGPRDIPCEDGLTCWLPDRESSQRDYAGYCMASQGDQRDPCETGIPALPCSDGLYCHPTSRRCTEADGTLGSYCGPATPPCRDELFCDETTLVCTASGTPQPPAELGEACGRAARGAPCVSGLQCHVTERVCVPQM